MLGAQAAAGGYGIGDRAVDSGKIVNALPGHL